MKLQMFDEEQIYYDAYETFCYQNCIRQILEYYKVEDAFMYINACLSIILEVKNEGMYRVRFGKNAYGLMPSVSQNMFRVKDNRESYLVWKDNLEYIKRDYPVIVSVDSYYLNHLPFYRKSHGSHCMIAVGEEKNMPVVIDWNAPWYYKGKVDLGEFLEARDSTNEADGGVFSGEPIKNNWAVVEKENWNISHEVLINDFLEGSKVQYKKSSGNGIYYGLDVYLKFQDILENMKYIEEGLRKKEMRVLYNAMYWPVKKKVFFEFYLRNIIKRKLISDEFEYVSDYVKQLCDEWLLFLNFLLKHSFIGTVNSIDKVKVKLEELIEKEKYLCDMIIGIHL